MATYKNKSKKRSNDKFVSYVIIGFAIAFFAILASLIIFNAIDDTPKYSDFDTVDDFMYIQTQDEEQYLVYFYSETCPACITIKTEVLEFANSNEAGIKVYLMDAAEVTGTNYIQQMQGTPSMLVIVDGEIVELAAGYEQIPQLMDAINNDTYTKIN